MTLAVIALIAVGAMLVVLVAVGWLTEGRFYSTVILGEDGRTSTSKTFIFMWTVLVAWALITLLIAGEFVPAHACVPPRLIDHAAHACKASHDQVGLLQVGWMHFVNKGLAGSYLILLGIPAAAGIAAKGITQSQVNSPTAFKSSKQPKERFHVRNLRNRLAEIVSADDCSTDIGDFQYLIFNLITAVYFVVQFLNPDGSGLPTMPATLLGLTSVSAGLYVGKKAVTHTQPTVTGVFPLPLHDSKSFTVLGTGLTSDPAAPGSTAVQITIDGMPATQVKPTAAGNLEAVAPPNLSGGGTPVIRQLQVLNPYGAITANFQVQCL